MLNTTILYEMLAVFLEYKCELDVLLKLKINAFLVGIFTQVLLHVLRLIHRER